MKAWSTVLIAFAGRAAWCENRCWCIGNGTL